jgi:GTP-binding protein HflX
LFEFERPRGGERALLVHVNLAQASDQDDLPEFIELVRSAAVEDVDLIVASRQTPSPRTFVGQGKLDEIAERVQALEVDVVLFNNALTPSQERNLERALKCRVLDRTGLILDIFAQRAQSFEGKLQVELAQLRHLSTRLVRGWTHLERQKGGIGLRGPGETQLETDRRLLSRRIQYLRSRLQKVERQREQSRQARSKAEIPTLSLVGYTNAGKSTLFNALTAADAYAADQLFATLDPTLRKLKISDQLAVILADTVGFIRHLPHDLVAAFRATLQETRDADLILHVIDCADEERDEKIDAVERVLDEVGAHETPRLMIFNKIDLTDVGPRIDRDEQGRALRVWLSAQTGEGFDLLRQVIAETFAAATHRCRIELAPGEGQLRARLHEQHLVLDEQYAEDGSMRLELQLSDVQLRRLVRHLDLDPDRFRFEDGADHARLAGVA